ncbi:peptidoglycan bridge formation glycyltransferase FemA/FemB family protein [Arcanobacterium haemolyticum]|nr:peptidoglycan bridge formation glycyltransferase FemA/FemB family protein [Arcanobacterium haemolyticum]
MSSPYVFVTQIHSDEFDAFVTKRPECNLLQSSSWAKVKESWDSVLTGVRDERGELVAAGLVLIRPLSLGYTMWYLPHGPILDYSRADVLSFYLTKLASYARTTRCVFIKVDPPVALEAAPLEAISGARDPHALGVLDQFTDAGYRHLGFTAHMHDTLQPRFTTATLRPQGDLLGTLPKRTRRFVKDAKNRYVDVVRVGHDRLDDFMAVISETEGAKGIRLRNRSYYERLLDVYGDNAMLYMAYIDVAGALEKYHQRIADAEGSLASLAANATQKRREYTQQIESHRKQIEALAQYSGRTTALPLAGCIGVLYGTGFEMLYAGMSRAFPKITAQDLVYVEMMNAAFDAGATYCSMGGVANTLDDGLMKFKAHFNPLVIEKLGEFDYPVRPVLYRAVKFMLDRR